MLPTVPLPALLQATLGLARVARVVRTHRVCAPEHAGWVATVCLYDRSTLPRWHQDDRGDRNAHRGYHEVAPAGAYRHVPVWHGRQHWLTIVVPVAIAVHRDQLRREELSAATFALWARVESGYAQDQRTGRRCIVRPATVASVMGCTANTVRKCRRVARWIGLQVVVVLGRMLSATECWAARRRGSSQRGLSTETALTVPSHVAAATQQQLSVTPTSGRAPLAKPHRHSPPLDAAHGEKRLPRTSSPPRRTPSTTNRPSPGRRPATTLARDLIQVLPWLHGERPGRLVPALTRFATAKPVWDAQDLVDAITQLRYRRGLTTPLPQDTIKTRPAVVLAAFLRQLDHHTDHPRLATVDPDELRCHRPTCDHGWITITPTPHTGNQGDETRVARCDQCRPGAWRTPTPDDLLEVGHLRADDEEPPF